MSLSWASCEAWAKKRCMRDIVLSFGGVGGGAAGWKRDAWREGRDFVRSAEKYRRSDYRFGVLIPVKLRATCGDAWIDIGNVSH